MGKSINCVEVGWQVTCWWSCPGSVNARLFIWWNTDICFHMLERCFHACVSILSNECILTVFVCTAQSWFAVSSMFGFFWGECRMLFRCLICWYTLLGLQVGQVHGGLMGVIQRATVKACPHVWFERSEIKDRHLVTKRWGVGWSRGLQCKCTY